MIDAIARLPHYREHIEPIWEALPPALRGTFHEWPERGGTGPVIVAGVSDVMHARGRPVVLVEHGAGQTYSSGHPSYPGGRQREAVVLFVCPSERVARANLEAYPNSCAVVVGSPRLDRLHRGLPAPEPDTIAVTFHWEAKVCPETRSAFRHYRRVMPELARTFKVLGHGHPRAWGWLERFWIDLGVEPVRSFDEVCRRASLLVFDNTSAGYEFASLDRPVVILNAPWYRRQVEWGLRFWSHADVGIQVDEPHELPGAVALALTEPAHVATLRREIVRQVYAYTDGRAAERAAAAIGEMFA